MPPRPTFNVDVSGQIHRQQLNFRLHPRWNVLSVPFQSIPISGPRLGAGPFARSTICVRPLPGCVRSNGDGLLLVIHADLFGARRGLQRSSRTLLSIKYVSYLFHAFMSSCYPPAFFFLLTKGDSHIGMGCTVFPTQCERKDWHGLQRDRSAFIPWLPTSSTDAPARRVLRRARKRGHGNLNHARFGLLCVKE